MEKDDITLQVYALLKDTKNFSVEFTNTNNETITIVKQSKEEERGKIGFNG